MPLRPVLIEVWISLRPVAPNVKPIRRYLGGCCRLNSSAGELLLPIECRSHDVGLATLVKTYRWKLSVIQAFAQCEAHVKFMFERTVMLVHVMCIVLFDVKCVFLQSYT